MQYRWHCWWCWSRLTAPLWLTLWRCAPSTPSELQHASYKLQFGYDLLLLAIKDQVALLVVMAQAGSFVPAEFMALCPFRSLFTRMGTGDSIETNSSSFMLECQVKGFLSAEHKYA
eukprot:scaffold84642_cov19-Tisochrysis_lutea.AAC.1